MLPPLFFIRTCISILLIEFCFIASWYRDSCTNHLRSSRKWYCQTSLVTIDLRFVKYKWMTICLQRKFSWYEEVRIDYIDFDRNLCKPRKGTCDYIDSLHYVHLNVTSVMYVFYVIVTSLIHMLVFRNSLPLKTIVFYSWFFYSWTGLLNLRICFRHWPQIFFLILAFDVCVYFPDMPAQKNMEHRNLLILFMPCTRLLKRDKSAILLISSYIC